MTKSMTAFARETANTEQGEMTWEVRSVNHRFLEPFVRLPEDLRGLEPSVRERLAARLGRGKVDCSLRYVPRPGAAGQLRLNRHYLEQLLAVSGEVAALVGGSAGAQRLRAAALARRVAGRGDGSHRHRGAGADPPGCGP